MHLTYVELYHDLKSPINIVAARSGNLGAKIVYSRFEPTFIDH